jgi:hypothetical protein
VRDPRARRTRVLIEFAAQQAVGDLEIVEGAWITAAVRMQVLDQRAEATLDRIEIAGRVQPEDVERRAPVH